MNRPEPIGEPSKPALVAVNDQSADAAKPGRMPDLSVKSWCRSRDLNPDEVALNGV
jgi:hypothetical protein